VTLQRKPSGEKEVPAVKRFAALSSFEEAVGAASYLPGGSMVLAPFPGPAGTRLGRGVAAL